MKTSKRFEAENAATRQANGQFARGTLQPGAKPFPPGTSGNPGGRPIGARLLRGWIEKYMHETAITLKRVAEDETAPVMQRAAALHWMKVATGQRGLASNLPACGPELHRILDFLDGKLPCKPDGRGGRRRRRGVLLTELTHDRRGEPVLRVTTTAADGTKTTTTEKGPAVIAKFVNRPAKPARSAT